MGKEPIIRIKNGLHHVTFRYWARTVRSLYGDKCVICGRADKDFYGGLHAHHIVPQAMDGDLVTALENGVCLCPDHHYMAHRGGFARAGKVVHVDPDEMNVVEDYLSSHITLILPTEQAQALRAAAAQEGKSVSRYITDAINNYAGEILLPPLDDDSKEKKQ